jgi:predicted amidophosphoribosyltransferase
VRGWLAGASETVVSVFFPAGCRMDGDDSRRERLVCPRRSSPSSFRPVRKRQLGDNQSGLTSKPLLRKLDLPHKSALWIRTRLRPDKQVLRFEERWASIRGAFATHPGSQVDSKRVLLVDDVLTTRATLDASARALLESGAKSVLGLRVARAARNSLPAPDSGNL